MPLGFREGPWAETESLIVGLGMHWDVVQVHADAGIPQRLENGTAVRAVPFEGENGDRPRFLD